MRQYWPVACAVAVGIGFVGAAYWQLRPWERIWPKKTQALKRIPADDTVRPPARKTFGEAFKALDLFDEIVLALGLLFITTGLWSIVGRAALIAPGIVLTWIALPTRRRLIESPGSDVDVQGLAGRK